MFYSYQIFIGYWIYIVKYSALIHMRRRTRIEFILWNIWHEFIWRRSPSLRVRLRHRNVCRIFHNVNSITFLLYTLKVTSLRSMIMLLTRTSKSKQCFRWPHFTSMWNPIVSTAKQYVHTHAKPRLLARNGKRRERHEYDFANQSMTST